MHLSDHLSFLVRMIKFYVYSNKINKIRLNKLDQMMWRILEIQFIINHTHIYMKINLVLFRLTFILLILSASILAQENKGEQRLARLRQRSLQSSTRIISFSNQDFKEYAMTYPRPYDLVIYFTANSCKLCQDLRSEYEYTASLYNGAGAITADKNPTFFVNLHYSNDVRGIFQTFGFTSAPNLVVSKPHMAVVSELEKKQYLQGFKWAISYSDGHVTTHKMLEFINKRTDRDVIYKPPLTTMLATFFGFISVAAVGVLIYVKLKFIWTNWIVWLVGSLLIYVTCVSGVVYDIIHDVPFVGRDKTTGEALIFADGNRQQYGAEGLVISLMICGIGLLFISVIIMGQKLQKKYSMIGSLAAIAVILFLVSNLQQIYKAKSWYGPSLYPPNGYLTGPISRDQGNNI